MTPQLDPEPEPEPGDWIIQIPSEKVELILDRFEQERAKDEPPKDAMAILLKAADEVGVGVTYIVLVKGGVNKVPTPDCMAFHLPRGRKTSREELQEAWEKCRR
ncbi:MAG: hypothetical protein ACLP7Q_20010 [Isosphaeraceae bacterium]